jgi:signal transduction histidine kinase
VAGSKDLRRHGLQDRPASAACRNGADTRERRTRREEVASQHKSQFLASISHELRTSLNATLGFNEMILDEIYGPLTPDVRSPLDEMHASGKPSPSAFARRRAPELSVNGRNALLAQ